MRKFKFQSGEYYHIYNRGVDKRDIFMDDKNYTRFLTSMGEFNKIEPVDSLYRLNQIRKKGAKPLRFPAGNRSGLAPLRPLVKIISYNLMPNHYHFILEQLIDGGISEFMKRLAGGYTCFFNTKYDRSGSLFQGPFKAIHIKDTGCLCKLFIYVNYNYEIHGLGKAKNWAWSSYLDSIGKRSGTLCNLDIIKDEFGSVEEFKKLAAEIIPEIQEEKKLKKYLLE